MVLLGEIRVAELLGGQFRQGDKTGPMEFIDPEDPKEFLEGVDRVRVISQHDRHLACPGIDNLSADVGTQGNCGSLLLSGNGDRREEQLPLDDLAFIDVIDFHDIDELVKLIHNLFEWGGCRINDDGDSAELVTRISRCDGQRVNVAFLARFARCQLQLISVRVRVHDVGGWQALRARSG